MIVDLEDIELDIQTPEWAVPLLEPARYKATYGGRASGKSHTLGENLVERMVIDPQTRAVCVREVQKSIQFSVKQLLVDKIKKFDLTEHFEIQRDIIRPYGYDGMIIFQGMQDHTADSIKSLEGFDIAWVEEAQSMSARSWRMLRPTIRKENSEIWCSWNPEQDDDAVDEFFRGKDGPPKNAKVIEVNIHKNPFLPSTVIDEYNEDKRRAYKAFENGDMNAIAMFEHVWHGGYNTRDDSKVFAGKYIIDTFLPKRSWMPYYGADWGFANDPTALTKMWIHDNVLYIEYEANQVGCEIDHLGKLFETVPGAMHHIIRADNSRPETISYMRRKGWKIMGAEKWAGSVEDGVEFIRSFDRIVIHPRCTNTIREFKNYSYKVNKAGDVLPQIVDLFNHHIDSIRYGLQPMIKVSVQNARATNIRRTQ